MGNVSWYGRRTKIVATIGPASSDPETIAALIEAGVDAVRLNMSHGTHDDHALRAERVREAERASGRPIALIADLQGPKLRIVELAEPLLLERGATVVVAGEGSEREDDIVVRPAVLGQVLQPGNEILIDDGRVRLRVERVERGRATCQVVVGGARLLPQGREPPRCGAPDPVDHPQGPRGS